MARRFPHHTPPGQMVHSRRAWRLDDTHYEVIGRDGVQRYELTLQPDGRLDCDCPAGQHDRTCYHAAVVARRLLREGIPDGALDELPPDGDDAFAPELSVL